MNQSKITVRYAKALFLLAKERNQLKIFKTDVSFVVSVFNESQDFKFLIDSPVVKTSQKLKAVHTIFEGKVAQETLRFLEMIIENKREQHLPAICRNFLEMIRKEQGIKAAVVNSVTSLSDEELNKMKKLLEDKYKGTIEMQEIIDESLLGGFILRVEDQQYDASIATRLKKVKENLLKTEI